MTTPTFSRQAFEDVASFLPIFEASGFDFGTWVVRQGSFPFVTYHPEVGRFVRTLERHGWVYESPDFLWGPWLRTPEAAKLLSGETLPAATPEQLARLLTVFARQERIVDGSRLEMYQSGVLLAGTSDTSVVEDTTGDDWEADRVALDRRELLRLRGAVVGELAAVLGEELPDDAGGIEVVEVVTDRSRLRDVHAAIAARVSG